MPPRLQPVRLAVSLILQPAVSANRRFILPLRLATQQRCTSILSSLSDNKGAYSKKIRRGRGPASGKGKTAGRGQKGQHAHGKVPAGFTGGQTPLEITNPERGRGKFNPFKVEMSPINLDRIQAWIDQGRLDPSKPITMKELAKSRCLHGVKRHGVKLLARNATALKTRINIILSRASAPAIAAIEALGGTVTTRFYSPTSIKRVLRGTSHPLISLQAPASLVRLAAKRDGKKAVPEDVLASLSSSSGEATSATMQARRAAELLPPSTLTTLTSHLSHTFPYRLPDATSRRDIEYYRDPAHRGYLSHTVAEGETPSLFFRTPFGAVDEANGLGGGKGGKRGKGGDRVKREKARRAKVSAESRLF